MPDAAESLTRLAAMPGKKQLALAIALLAALAGLSACGSSTPKTIPPADSQAMLADLEAAQNAVTTGDCTKAQEQVQAFKADVNGLPATTGDDVKSPLQDAAENLEQLTTDQCTQSPVSGATGQEGAQSSTTPPPDSTTESTTSSTSSSTAEEPPVPPENGGGSEGGGNEGGGPPSGGEDNGGTGGTGGTGTGGTSG